jgi:hypothetical protein
MTSNWIDTVDVTYRELVFRETWRDYYRSSLTTRAASPYGVFNRATNQGCAGSVWPKCARRDDPKTDTGISRP